MTFKLITSNMLPVVLLVQQMHRTDTLYYNISSIILGFMGRKVLYYINVKFNNAMLFLCPSVSVCSI